MSKTVLLIALCFLLSCDSNSNTKTDPFKGAWGRTQVLIENAPSDSERVRLIDNFIVDFKGHSNIVVVKTARAKYAANSKNESKRKEQAKQAARKITDENRDKMAKVFESGDVIGSTALLAPELFRVGTRRSRTETLSQPVALNDLMGREQKLSQQTSIGIGTIRPTIRYLLRRLKVVDSRCNRVCVNEKLSAMFEGTLDGKLVDGWKLNPKALTVLISKLDIDGEQTIAKLPIAKLLSPFEKTMKSYATARDVIRKSGDKKLLKKFNAELKTNPESMLRWYDEAAVMTNVAKAIPDEPAKRSSVITGFWVRRISDGTADSIEAALKSALNVIEKSR